MNIFKKALIVALSIGLISVPTVTKEVEAATFVEGDKIYLDTGGTGLWDADNAWFVAGLNNGSQTKNITMEDGETKGDHIYEITFSAELVTFAPTKVTFYRVNPTITSFTGTSWNKTPQLTISGNLYTKTGWGDSEGKWSTYYYNPTNLYVGAQSVENSDDYSNSIKFVSALPKGTQAKKNEKEDYNVGLKFDFQNKVDVESGMPAGKVLYLIPNTNWNADNARFAAYFFGAGEKWVSMTKVGTENLYQVTVPAGGYTKVIFCRMNPSAAANNWDNKWNQTADLSVTGTNNCYQVASGTWNKGGGTWTTKAADVITKTGYYTCDNLAAVAGYDATVVGYEVETYFAVTITDIPNDFDGGTVTVTPAYQSENGTTIMGTNPKTFTMTFGETGITLAA